MALFDPPANVTTATGMIEWINSTTGQWLFQGIISIVFAISLITMLKNPQNTASKSFFAASFVVMLISVMVRTLNLIPTYFMTLWIVLTGLAAIWMYVEGTK